MTTAPTARRPQIEALLQALPSQQIKTAEELATAISQVTDLTICADTKFIGARAAALLADYPISDQSDQQRLMRAEDWIAELRRFPQWALLRAFRWWTSADNPHRYRRPLEGDIAERAEKEMEPVRIAQKRLAMAERSEVVKNG